MASFTKSLPDGWQDKTIIGLSVLLAASPWLLGYADLANAKWNAVIVGGLLSVGSASMLVSRPHWPGFVTAFVAFWLAGSSRILAFDDQLAATMIAAIIGSAVVVLALWSAGTRARAHYFAANPNVVAFEPPVQPPPAPQRPGKAA